MLANALLLGLRAMRRNVLRSLLTMLGVIIGVAAVIILVILGKGVTQQVTEQISSLGSNLLMVTAERKELGQIAGVQFKPADAEAIARDINSLAAVAATASSSINAIFTNANWATQVTGITENYFTVTKRQIILGRGFTESETHLGASLCVIGETLSVKLFGQQSPIGNKIRLQKLSCEVIGLLKAKGQSAMGSDQDDIVLIPLRTFHRRIAGNQDVSLIQASVKGNRSTVHAKQEMEQLLRLRRHLADNEENNFSVIDMKEIATMLSTTTRMLTRLLGSVAAISLLVGGIGIMNIMLVSVTERTREIGIRLAVGAQGKDVLLQFLVEASVLSSSGGLIGIMLALVVSRVLAALLKVPFVFNLPIVLVAFFFSVSIGIIFGYVPARKAARLNPIDALRQE